MAEADDGEGALQHAVGEEEPEEERADSAPNELPAAAVAALTPGSGNHGVLSTILGRRVFLTDVSDNSDLRLEVGAIFRTDVSNFISGRSAPFAFPSAEAFKALTRAVRLVGACLGCVQRDGVHTLCLRAAADNDRCDGCAAAKASLVTRYPHWALSAPSVPEMEDLGVTDVVADDNGAALVVPAAAPALSTLLAARPASLARGWVRGS